MIIGIIGGRRYAAASLHRRGRAGTASLTRAVEGWGFVAVLSHRPVCCDCRYTQRRLFGSICRMAPSRSTNGVKLFPHADSRRYDSPEAPI